jgi:hypothetical protein
MYLYIGLGFLFALIFGLFVLYHPLTLFQNLAKVARSPNIRNGDSSEISAPSLSVNNSGDSHTHGRRPKVIHNVVLLGQFNYHTDHRVVLHWVRRWHEIFDTVVVSGPFTEAVVHVLRESSIRVYESENDRGWYSPIRNIARVIEDYQHTEGIDGVLYMHDDAMLNMTQLIAGESRFNVSELRANFQSSEWFNVMETNHTELVNQRKWKLQQSWPEWFYAAQVYKPPPRVDFRIPSDTRTLNRGQFLRTCNWKWASLCADGAARAFMDPRSQEFREDDGSLAFPSPGQSDFAFIPFSAGNVFVPAAEWLVDNKVFLECALPMLARLVLRDNGTSTRYTTLCTSWTLRGSAHALVADCMSQGLRTSVYHPIKPGDASKLSAWDAWFNYIVLGVDSFPAESSK